jgi:CRP-like cAMP-binding protein
MNNLDEFLTQAHVFRKLSIKELQSLREAAKRKKVGKREYLFHLGDIWPNIVCVGSGQLRWAMLSAGGREHVLFLLEPGQVFWSHSIFDDLPMPASLMALKPSVVYIWPREVILPFLHRNPEAMWEVTHVLVKSMRRAREVIYGLAFLPVVSRLARVLIEHSELQDEAHFERDITLSEIASRVATSNEVACRALYQLQSEGFIQINRANISINDQDGLKNLVESK